MGLWIGGKREQKEVGKNESGLAMLSSANLLSRLGLLRFGVMRVTSDDRKMINAANRLHKALDRAFSHDNCPFSMELARELEVFRSAAAHLRWSYPILCELQTVTPKERLATMFSGPLYTSELHPWPVNKRGKPFEPICQIDLTIPSQLSGLMLGDGLLQLWMDGVFGCLRLLPKHEVQISALTPVADSVINHVWNHPKAMRLHGTNDPWLQGHCVSAVLDPVLTIPQTLVSRFDERPELSGKMLNAAFDAMESALQADSAISRGAGQFGFFGNFYNIQYDEIDCPEALLLMETGDVFSWGDCGNAQIFYEFDKGGKVKFSFDWSC